jgi:hypothetical protein
MAHSDGQDSVTLVRVVRFTGMNTGSTQLYILVRVVRHIAPDHEKTDSSQLSFRRPRLQSFMEL